MFSFFRLIPCSHWMLVDVAPPIDPQFSLDVACRILIWLARDTMGTVLSDLTKMRSLIRSWLKRLHCRCGHWNKSLWYVFNLTMLCMVSFLHALMVATSLFLPLIEVLNV